MGGVRGTALALLLAFAAPLPAHEVETNRLTLVLRDRNHISLTYFIDYPAALHQALAPKRPFSEFIVMYSAMAPVDFQRALGRAHEQLQTGTRLSLPSGDLTITGWKWPTAERAQGLLREVAMAALASPSDHTHLPPLEVRAEAVARQEIASLDVQLPTEVRDVLIVSYRPNQTLAKPDRKSRRVRF